ncbi:MAG: hypothetical protein HFI76_11955 [Lachnospiraceae bacterium]|jgi:hypothetical protein|nr:hypothetical protein [Lachnospiraceae bacterium]
MNLETITSCTGTVQTVMPSPSICGAYSVTLAAGEDSVCIHLTPQTYVVDCVLLRPGMHLTAFHTPDLLPSPQPSAYPAFLVAQSGVKEQVVLNYFDQTLTAQDDSLRLNISSQTDIQTFNGQRFTCHPGNRVLLVFYSITTRSLPPQTSPRRIIVL